MREKIVFVVQRYGKEVNGGAEYHCRELAEHMADRYEVDVLTSCARDYVLWNNYYLPGIEKIGNVTVHRFLVEQFDEKDVEDVWSAKQGPYCPSLVLYLKNHADEYKAVVFITYGFYPTVEGLKLSLENSIFIPTAHDEPGIYLPVFKNLFSKARAILYNSIEEKEFLLKNFDLSFKPSRLGCVGITIPDEKEYDLPVEIEKYRENYIVYVGRVNWNKNFQELNRYFIEYKKRNPSPLKLIVVGRIDEGMKIIYSQDIIFVGFVTEEEKTAIMKGAKVLIAPSLYESLSLVILESMALKKPVLVNGRCDVLKGQCIRSNAGLYYTNYFEFEEGLNYILSNHEAYEQMCDNGFRFVKEKYDWKQIVQNVDSLIEEIQI